MQNKASVLADSTLRLLGWRCVCVCVCVCVCARALFPFRAFWIIYAEKRLGQYRITDIVIIIMTTMIIVIVIIITDRFGQMARRTNVLRTNGKKIRSDILGLLTRRFNGLSRWTITRLSISRTITMSDYVPRHTRQTAPMAYLQAFEADATVE